MGRDLWGHALGQITSLDVQNCSPPPRPAEAPPEGPQRRSKRPAQTSESLCLCRFSLLEPRRRPARCLPVCCTQQ
eukprot:7324113-Pyramimonas_sp.AAC.1